MSSSRQIAGRWLLNAALVVLGLLMFAPFYWMLLNAVLPERLAFKLPPIWWPQDLTLDHFGKVFELIPFGMFVVNSLKITAIVTVGVLVTSTLAAYAFARLQFPGRDVLFIVLLASLMVPGQVTVVPTFIVLRTLGLVDTHEAVYLPQLINVLGIFLLRQWFLTLPRELEDAARIDGAGHVGILRHVVVPLSGPPLAALAIFCSQQAWNDFFWPNIMLSSPEKMTLPVGLVYLQGQYGTGSPVVIFAAIAMVVVPVLILFLAAQRPITQSLALTGLRG
ncbi:MAG TPA: carbohydrate ABC transporter permease [Actinopolymorphaceae bacterium]|jgi:multiple sugar transport system permease protein